MSESDNVWSENVLKKGSKIHEKKIGKCLVGKCLNRKMPELDGGLHSVWSTRNASIRNIV